MARADSWIDGLAEGVVLVEGDRIVRINAAAGRILGTDPGWAEGKGLIAVLRDHRLQRACLQGEEVEVTLSGRIIEAVPLAGGLALRDVTEMRRATAGAEELLAVLSHELRTPLTTVRATLDALGFEDLAPEEHSRLLERAIGESERVVRLLGDLTVDVTPPRERTVSLSASVARAELILAPTLDERALRLVHELGDIVVWADPDKVLQVLLNLIQNAATYGPPDSGIEVRAVAREGWVELLVRDCGKPLEIVPRALDGNLERPADAKSRKGGLGLFIVRSIAEGWGGTAWWRVWHRDDRTGNEFGVSIPGSRQATRRFAPDSARNE